MKHNTPSRKRFEKYRAEFHARGHQPISHHGRDPTAAKPRDRSALDLTRLFLRMLKGHRLSMAFSLATLTVATLLALVPPAATKFVVDNVLGGEPLPDSVPRWVPREPWPLLVWIGGGLVAISIVEILLHVSGRWHATRVTKLLQMSVRRQVIDQALRLPLHRVQELKSGGTASILRQDAGSVGELVFGLLYNPWRAVIQLVGSMLVLAWVDWRLLSGALVLVPLVYFTHRTWIGRIRPQFKGVRAQREAVDALATESFGGLRVVRAFSRQRAESNRIMRGNHLMGRQELYAWWWMRAVEVVWEILVPLASAALLLYGGSQVLEGRSDAGRTDDVSGVLADAAEPIGRPGAECGRVSKQPVGIRSRPRLARRAPARWSRRRRRSSSATRTSRDTSRSRMLASATPTRIRLL